jgi:hypothetical protein
MYIAVALYFRTGLVKEERHKGLKGCAELHNTSKALNIEASCARVRECTQ